MRTNFRIRLNFLDEKSIWIERQAHYKSHAYDTFSYVVSNIGGYEWLYPRNGKHWRGWFSHTTKIPSILAKLLLTSLKTKEYCCIKQNCIVIKYRNILVNKYTSVKYVRLKRFTHAFLLKWYSICAPAHQVKLRRNAVIYGIGVWSFAEVMLHYTREVLHELEIVHTVCRMIVFSSSVFCVSPSLNSPSSLYISRAISTDSGWPVTHTTKAATSCHVVRSKWECMKGNITETETALHIKTNVIKQ